MQAGVVSALSSGPGSGVFSGPAAVVTYQRACRANREVDLLDTDMTRHGSLVIESGPAEWCAVERRGSPIQTLASGTHTDLGSSSPVIVSKPPTYSHGSMSTP
ncbi:hypothetical protein DPEC_G00138480 [Dallia pectoralis]|uniref:Uncharacterized protein n=1 Tax=Dallia pectoralis TaxID=75939 RepID=A0ACC2GMG5_DALPE|nr:hypothetical protein DPEC_G00138480 [Dallia pectoralis]